MRPAISVTIITLNEEKNLPRALASVRWADEIIVVDSGSSDRTLEIATQAGARVISNPWPGYGKQKNFAQAQATHLWVLNIDADECVSPALRSEIEATLSSLKSDTSGPQGFEIPRKTYYLGRWILHGGWYPNHLCRLVNRGRARWSEPEVHEALVVEGSLGRLHEPLLHYSFNGIQDQVRTNLRFSRLGYAALLRKGVRFSLLRLLFKPLGKFFETYFFKLGLLDGLPGLIISVNAAHSMFLKYAYFLELEDKDHAHTDHR